MEKRKIISYLTLLFMIASILLSSTAFADNQNNVENSITKVVSKKLESGKKYDKIKAIKINSSKLDKNNIAEEKLKIGEQNIQSTINILSSTESEPNDYPEQANPISLGGSIQGTIGSSTDQDWHYFYSGQSGKFTVRLENIPQGVDYDLYLYKRDGEYVYRKSYSIYSGNSSEKLSHVDGPGDYYILVKSYSGYNASSNYMVYTHFTSNYDSYEPNDNFFFPTQISTGNIEHTPTLDNENDDDFFKIYASSGEQIVIDAYGLPNDYDMALFDSSGNLVDYSVEEGTIAEHIAYNTTAAGDYIIRVMPFNWSSAANYKLRVNKRSIKMLNRPVGEFIPVTYYYDLDRNLGSLRDWTGWTGIVDTTYHTYDNHNGTDYDGASGDNVYACKEGTVIELVQDPNNTYPDGPYTNGTYINVAHSGNYYTIYAHLQYQSTLINLQDTVYANQRVGLMGNTGYSFGDHLHLGVINGSDRICPYDNGLIHYGGAMYEN